MRRRRLSFADYVAMIPLAGPSRPTRADATSGSWVGYFMRAVLRYDLGADAARLVVAQALGPGHDHEPLGRGDNCDGSKGGPSTGVGYAWDGNRRTHIGGAD